MKVILKNKIVDVKEGYARNYLFPYKLAIPATEENVRKLEQSRRREKIVRFSNQKRNYQSLQVSLRIKRYTHCAN